MSFETRLQAPGRAYASQVRAAVDREAAGARKNEALEHLRAADQAEMHRDEARWILEIDLAARALE